MDGSADGALNEAEAGPAPADDLARALGVGRDSAQRLIDAGYGSADSVRELSSEALERLGIPPADLSAIRENDARPRTASVPPGMDVDGIVEKWAGSVRRSERSSRPKIAPARKGSTEVLRKWIGGDDRAMEDWIRSSEGTRPGTPLPSVPEAGPAGPAAPSPEGGARLDPVQEREETVVRWLTGLLDRVTSGQFDASSVIQEVQDLQRQLFDERAKSKQLEEQVEHVKRGSIAVIKYVRSREGKERDAAVQAKDEEIASLKLRLAALEGSGVSPASPSVAGGVRTAPVEAPRSDSGAAETERRLRVEFSEREHEFIDREAELRRRVVQLEGQIRNLSSAAERAEGQANLLARDSSAVPEALARQMQSVADRERDLVGRENELRTKFEEIRLRAEEVERRRSGLEFKGKELSSFDQQLQTRRQALDLEARRLEGLRRETESGATKIDQAQRLEELSHELAKREAELRGREAELADRRKELDELSGTAAGVEAERLHAESVAAEASPKVRSGVRRLDDLLFGGYPPGAQVLINGPAHTGKDVLGRLFSTEGLRSGIPTIWVVTDKTWRAVRDDLEALYPKFAEAERAGMVRYVDVYSLSVSSPAPAPGVRFLSPSDKAILDQLGQAVHAFAEELKEKFHGYRLVFESVSTITAYLDTTATFRFLQPFVGRRKLDGAVGYYVLESGMHSEADLETLEHMVDGSLNLKIEQMKTFLAVRGIGDAQARSWVGYTFTKRSFNLGSFSLEHIR
jgi:KaiC/GvpD/RAD55 family RecA-like ATPase